MSVDMEVEVEPCDASDKGRQKCRLGLRHLKLIGANIESFVKISHRGITAICSVWPQNDPPDTSLKYDDIVTVKPKCEYSHAKTVDVSSIELISVSRCDRLEVTLVISDTKDISKWRKFQRKSPECLVQYCKNCLVNLCVASDYHVNLSYSNLGQCYGFSGVFVHSLSSEEKTVGAVITRNCHIKVKEIISQERFKLRTKRRASRLGGLEKPAQDLIDVIKVTEKCCERSSNFGFKVPRGILLRGPPGCGKTSLVKHVASVCDAFLVSINGPEIFGSLPGESEENLRRVFDSAGCHAEEGMCLLFIDEIDSLCPKQGRSSGGQESRVTAQLVTSLDNLPSDSRVVVIAATNRPASLHPSIRRPGRFDREVMINIPTEVQRGDILRVHSSCLPLAEDVDLSEVAAWTKGYVGADLFHLCQEAAYLAMAHCHTRQQGQAYLDVVRVTMGHFKSAISQIVPSTQRGSDALVDLKPVQWSDIGGLEDVKQKIKQAVEWPMKHPGAFSRLGLPVLRGLLLYGPPGCCKTTLIRAAATASGATFLAVSSAQLFSPLVGDAERAVSEVFQRARMGSPAILFLDEVEAITGKRSESGHTRGVQERVLSTLLNEIDGVGIRLDEKMDSSTAGRWRVAEGESSDPSDKMATRRVDNRSVLVVAATNRPDLIDDALLRPGRLDRIIYVPPPDMQARCKVLDMYVSRLPAQDVDTASLATMTENFTGADLENLCREAALIALTQDGMEAKVVTQRHFTEALRTVKPSLSELLLEQYDCLKLGKS